MADIQISNITNSTALTDGTGIFDKLIQAVELHIEAQFKAGRLAGTDFANVYLGSLQSVLQQSIAFTLGEQKADKDADLVTQQILTEVQNTLLITEKYESEAKLNELGGVIDLQKTKLSEDTDLTIAQTAKAYEDITASQSATLASVAEITAESNRKDNLTTAQIVKIEAELTKQWGYTVTNTASVISLSADAGTGFMDWKIKSESASTSNANIGSVGAGTGTMGRQRDLYATQSAGFVAKHKNDNLKLMLDSWSLTYSVLEGALGGLDVELPSFLQGIAVADSQRIDVLATTASTAMDNIT